MPRPKTANRTTRRSCRPAAASVELAVVLPLLVLILTATIEACSMIHLTQSLYIAAYEATRVCLIPKTKASDALDAAEELLSTRNIRDARIIFSPSDPTSVPIGSTITVTVEAPAISNSPVTSLFFRGRTMSGSCTMMKEY